MSEHSGNSEHVEHAEHAEHAQHAEHAEYAEHAEHAEYAEHAEHLEEHLDHADEKFINDIYPVVKTIYRYTLKVDLPDPNHVIKVWSLEQIAKDLPVKIDLRNEFMPPVFDQGALGSCTANAISGAFSYQYSVENKILYEPSRLFIYYNERLLEGHVNEDSGAQISTGIKVVNKFGTCAEDLWPYDVNRFTARPKKSIYKASLKNKAISYSGVKSTLNDFKISLNHGFPVIFGVAVPMTIEHIGADGFMPTYEPNNPTNRIVGGHAILCVGYDDDLVDIKSGNKGFAIIRNSWSENYADKGYFYIPYSFFDAGLISDSWVLSVVD